MGFIHFEFEGNSIYLSRDDYKYGIYKNGLWLSIPKSDISQYRNINDTFALVEGTFNAGFKGHLGYSNGAIENIRRIERLKSR